MEKESYSMFNVCPRCGEYRVEKVIDRTGPFAICPVCQYHYPFVQLPLFLITGASGVGKTTICLALASELRGECVVLETDILWGATNVSDEDYVSVWLRMAKNIQQSGLAVVLCGSLLPERCASSPEGRFFSEIHALAMVCNDELLAQRLHDRPAWRQTHAPEVIERMISFQQYFREQAATSPERVTLYDTGQHSLEETVQAVATWIRERLPEHAY
jgi:broad-specificity NMP kinase